MPQGNSTHTPLGGYRGGSADLGTGYSLLGPMDLLAEPNVTALLHWINQLSPEKQRSLYEQLGVKHVDEIFDILGLSDHPNHTMHVKSYEEQLMSFTAYRLHKNILLYVPPILIIMGTFGNIFSFLILKRKAMLKFSTYFYLMVLAVADTLVLHVGLLRLWLAELTGYELMAQADWLCKLTCVISYTASDFSVWLIIAVTVERFIVVCYPLKANSYCNTARAKRVIFGLIFILFCLNLHFFWTVQVVTYHHKDEEIHACAGGPNYELLVDEIWPWVDIMLYSCLPFLIICVLNIRIIRQVILAHRSRDQLQAPRNTFGFERRRPSHEGSTRLTIMLLAISFAFLLTTLPLTVVNIGTAFWNTYASDLKIVSNIKLARTITEMLMYINHSMNFFLYCATGQKFRHQLIWMLCYARRSTYFTWASEGPTQTQGTRMDTLRTTAMGQQNNGICVHNRKDMYATVKSEMYIPLKTPL